METQRPSAAAAAAGARERIARLRQAYLAQLPERVAQARALCDSLAGAQAGSEAAAHLHRLLHNLKGTGRSFGLTELGACAERGEDLLLPLVDVAPDGTPGAALQALPADWRAQLAQCLDELAVLAAGLGTAATGSPVSSRRASNTSMPALWPRGKWMSMTTASGRRASTASCSASGSVKHTAS